MRRIPRRVLVGVLLCLVLVTGSPIISTAAAAPIESFIGFGFLDDGTPIPDGQRITSQFERGDGIQFVPAIVNVNCHADHPECDAARTGSSAGAAPTNQEFLWEPFNIQFTDHTRDDVSFALRAMALETGPIPYVIQAVNGAGEVIDNASGMVDDTWIDVSLTGTHISETIAAVRVSGGPGGNHRLLIDDLRATGDDTNPPPPAPASPTVRIDRPTDEARIGLVDVPGTVPVDFEVAAPAGTPLLSVHATLRHFAPTGLDVVKNFTFCSAESPTAPVCPAAGYRTPSNQVLPIEETGRYKLEVVARTGDWSIWYSQATGRDHVFFEVDRVEPDPVLLGVEINQGIQGFVTVTDPPATLGAQEYQAHAVLVPGRDTLIRLFRGASRRTTSIPEDLVVEVHDRSGVRTTHTLPVLPPGPVGRPDLPAVDVRDQEDWPAVIEAQRRNLDTTLNYVLPADLIPDPVEVTIFPEDDPRRMRAPFGQRTRVGVNVVGLFDDANGIPITTLEEFEADGLPAMRAMMPVTEVEALSFTGGHWSELPHSSNDHENDPDDPKDDEAHEPGCAIAASMRWWGFGSANETAYEDLTNSWVFDAGVMANGKSDRGLRGCAHTPFDPPRTNGTFASDLDETLVHEAGHILGFPHASSDHGAAGAETWPYPHAIGPRHPDDFQVHAVYGVVVQPDPAVPGGWDVELRDPCLVGDCPTPRVPCETVNPTDPDCEPGVRWEVERHEIMSYGQARWTSVITWNRIYEMIVHGRSHDATDPELEGPLLGSTGSPAAAAHTSAALMAAEPATTTAAVVMGRRTADGAWVIDQVIPKRVLADALAEPDAPEPDVVVRSVDAEGSVLDERGVVLGSTDPGPEGSHVFAPLAFHSDVAAYELVVDGVVVATLGPQGSTPTLADVSVTPPSDGFVTASWRIVDDAPGTHTTVLMTSVDDGATWQPGAWVQPGQADRVRLWVGDVPDETEVRVRIVTTDRFSADQTEVAGPTCRGLEPTIIGDGAGAILGTDEADVIMGTAGDDVIDGRQGDDVICGAGGDDEITGDVGDDVIDGGDGADVIDGNQGRDRVWGGIGDDRLLGGRGDDELRGEEGDDVLRGGLGGDLLVGGPGLDTVDGGPGKDVITS